MSKTSVDRPMSLWQLCQLAVVVARATYRLRGAFTATVAQDIIRSFAVDPGARLNMLARRLYDNLADVAHYNTKAVGGLRSVK